MITLAVKLESARHRLLTLVAMSVVGVAFTSVVVSNFIIRSVADYRRGLAQEALKRAAARFPNSARVNFRLANSEIVEGLRAGQDLSQAEMRARRAVNLAPWDYRARRLLAIAQEANGKGEEAEAALRAGVRLAPNYAEINWALAQLLVRRGKLEESFEPFRVAARADGGFMWSAIETIWEASGGRLERLEAFAGNGAEARMSIVFFLLERNLVEEAVKVYKMIDDRAGIAAPGRAELIGALIKAGRIGLARELWLGEVSIVRGERSSVGQESDGGDGGLIWNGGFEREPAANFGHFDWTIGESQYARVVIDRNVGRTGARSLKVVFAGLDTTRLEHEARQLIVVQAGGRYRLECWAKPSELLTPEGPRVAIVGPGGVIGSSAAVEAAREDWQRLTVDFVAPAGVAAVEVRIIRHPRFSYDDPTRGIIRFDDFSLVRVGQ